MRSVSEQFISEEDSTRFRHLAQMPGAEPCHAHIPRYAFELHIHEAFGTGAIEVGVERFRYRGTRHVAPVHSAVTMNPDELYTSEAETADGRHCRMIYLESYPLEEVTGIRHWRSHSITHHDPLRSCQICPLIHSLWNTENLLTQKGLLLDLIDTLQPLARRILILTEGVYRSERVCKYLHDNYTYPIMLDRLARVVPLSPQHFQRQLKSHFHVTLHQILMTIRLW